MSFMLRCGPREIDLPVGRFLIGRAESAQLPLDDPLVSRHHAAIDVTHAGATLSDLESRNGVRVNGVRITAPHALAVGDKVSIGSTELVLVLRDGDLAAQTLVQAPTMRMQAFGLFGMLADKALAMGRGDEAERLLAPQIEQLLSDVVQGKKYDPSAVERASIYALRLAQSTGKPSWMDAVFRFYRGMGRICPSAMVDELYAVARKVKEPNRGELRQYLEVLRSVSQSFGPAERFLLGRLEGLERSLG
jgi:pSer/pThr/pTyr-binding forkhead associated (FHA) protein